MEELKGRITARQDWIAREQDSVDSKIEEATRPVAAQRTEAAQHHTALDEQVKELRCAPTPHPVPTATMITNSTNQYNSQQYSKNE